MVFRGRMKDETMAALPKARWQVSAALVLVTSLATGGCDRPAVSRTLVFEFDADAGDEAALKEMVVAVVDRRLSEARLGRARGADGFRFEVDVYGERDDTELDGIERLVVRPGTLAFRIVANRRNSHPHDIEAAVERFPESGSEGLEWRPMRSRELAGKGDDEALSPDGTHLLTVVPPASERITGEYLARVSAISDPATGMPAVSITFNAAGGARMQRLTEQHRPEADGFTHRLAILMDGEIVSAPTVMAPVGTTAQITGRFTQAEVDEIARVLKSGALPCPVRRVQLRPPGGPVEN